MAELLPQQLKSVIVVLFQNLEETQESQKDIKEIWIMEIEARWWRREAWRRRDARRRREAGGRTRGGGRRSAAAQVVVVACVGRGSNNLIELGQMLNLGFQCLIWSLSMFNLVPLKLALSNLCPFYFQKKNLCPF